VQGLFAELDPRTPHRRESDEWVIAPNAEILVRTGYLLADGRRRATSLGLVLAGAAAVAQEGGFRLEPLAPGRYRLELRRPGLAACELMLRVAWPRRLVLRAASRGGRGFDPGTFDLRVALEPGGAPAAGVELRFELQRALGAGDWARSLARPEPLRAPGLYRYRGLQPGPYRVRVHGDGLRSSEWMAFEVAAPRPRRGWVAQRPANGWKKNPDFAQIPAGNWDRGEGLILFGGEGRAPLARRLALRAERNEPLVIDAIFVEGRDARGRRRTFTFFEPYIYDVSRMRARGYALFEYVTPPGQRWGTGVYLNHRVELPPPMAGLQWPPYAREFTAARRGMRHPERAYGGYGKKGEANEGQYAILTITRGKVREQGEVRMTLPQPISVERIRIRRFAPDATLVSIHVEVAR
jgi:hypothetical protein